MALNEQLNEVGGVLSSLLNSPLHRILHTAQISALTQDSPTITGTGGRANPFTLSTDSERSVGSTELESSSEFVRGSRSNWPRLRQSNTEEADDGSDEVCHRKSCSIFGILYRMFINCLECLRTRSCLDLPWVLLRCSATVTVPCFDARTLSAQVNHHLQLLMTEQYRKFQWGDTCRTSLKREVLR